MQAKWVPLCAPVDSVHSHGLPIAWVPQGLLGSARFFSCRLVVCPAFFPATLVPPLTAYRKCQLHLCLSYLAPLPFFDSTSLFLLKFHPPTHHAAVASCVSLYLRILLLSPEIFLDSFCSTQILSSLCLFVRDRVQSSFLLFNPLSFYRALVCLHTTHSHLEHSSKRLDVHYEAGSSSVYIIVQLYLTIVIPRPEKATSIR